MDLSKLLEGAVPMDPNPCLKHPTRPATVNQLCADCNVGLELRCQGARGQRMADCHPDRAHVARGLCRQCYMSARSRNFQPKAPKAPNRVNDCGHADRPHCARGMCKSCYIAARMRGEFRSKVEDQLRARIQELEAQLASKA